MRTISATIAVALVVAVCAGCRESRGSSDQSSTRLPATISAGGEVGTPDIADVYEGLRSQVLSIKPEEIDLTPSTDHPNVWGILMEMHVSGNVVTQVALLDGTTSLYFSSGGGIIGGGEHERVRNASLAELLIAEGLLANFTPADSFPLPEPGRVRFYALTFSGPMSADAEEDSLISASHPLAELWSAGQDVVHEVSLIEPAGKMNPPSPTP